MKVVELCAALWLVSGSIAAALADDKPQVAETGTTLIGQRDAAVGLYLLRWKEEAPSDIDRPPRQFDGVGEAVDPTRFAADVANDDANTAYRRVRLEPK